VCIPGAPLLEYFVGCPRSLNLPRFQASLLLVSSVFPQSLTSKWGCMAVTFVALHEGVGEFWVPLFHHVGHPGKSLAISLPQSLPYQVGVIILAVSQSACEGQLN
jgi:hypothetical protein